MLLKYSNIYQYYAEEMDIFNKKLLEYENIQNNNIELEEDNDDYFSIIEDDDSINDSDDDSEYKYGSESDYDYDIIV